MSTTTDVLEYIVAFTPGQVWAGRLESGVETMVRVSGTGLLGEHVQSMSMIDPVDGRSKVFATDGSRTIVVDVLGDSIEEWADRVAAVGAGSLPAQCALVTRWRGRALHAVQPTNNAIFFLSRSGNPFDYDYNAEPLANTALAGTDPTVGLPGDAIKALIPFSEDYVGFGCQSSIYVMSGDPTYGGILNLVSDRTGVVGPDAWTIDESGVAWLLGPSGLYRMVSPDEKPELVSGRRLLQFLEGVDLTMHSPKLGFDARRKEFLLSFPPMADGTSDQPLDIVYDLAADAFSLDEYPTRMRGTALLGTDGLIADQRTLMIGGADGYVRRWDDAAKGDDGEKIDAWFDTPAFEAASGLRMGMVSALEGTAAAGTNPCTWMLFTGETLDEVARQESHDLAAASGAIFANGPYQRQIGIRRRAAAFKFRVRQESFEHTWRLGRLTAYLEQAGRRR